MNQLNESNFKESIAGKKVIVMFYRESGCSFCDQAKPIFKEYAEQSQYDCAMYALGNVPDKINQEFPIERFPTFYAFDNGQAVNKIEGVPSFEKLDAMFAPKKIKIEEAALSILIQDELVLIDQVAAIKMQLNAVQAEIKKRKELAGVL